MRSPRVVVFAVGLVVLMLFQVALVGSPVGPARVVRAAPPASLTIGVLSLVDSLNPYIGINEPSSLLYSLLYDYPFSYDQDGNLVSNLVTSATCDSVCMNWTYTVRQGVTWSDGTNLTAQDVAFTWNYDSQNLFHLWAYEPYFNQVVVCTPTNQPHCGAVVSASNPWNVTVYFQRPYAAGRTLFAPIVEKAQWSNVSPLAAETTYANANPIGTGPFVADPNIYMEWQQQPSVPLHVYRNPNYHPFGSHTGSSVIQDLYIQAFSDPSSLAQAVQSGTVQLAEMTVGGLQAVKGLPNVTTQAALQAIQKWNYVGITQIDTSAADGRLNPARWDVNVRRAMAYATNKDYIVQQFYAGQGMRGDSLISPITPQWWYDPVAGGDNLTFNVVQANALLNASGYTVWTGGSFGNGYREAANPITVSFQTACYQCVDPANVTKTIPAGTLLAFTMAVRPASVFPEEVNTAQYLQSQYAAIGIRLTIKVETTEAALATDVYNGNVETYIWFWSGDPDPNYLISMQSSWTLDGWNDNYWNNGTYNHAFLAEMGDLNPTQRMADVKAAEKIQYEAAVFLIYAFPYGQWAMRTDLWQGWGDWSAHPYRQMDADWGANPLWFDLNCPTCGAGQNQPPAVPVIGGPSSVLTYPGVSLTFNATTSDPETSDLLNWTWSWGDGTTSNTTGTAANPVSAASHAWATPGTYLVNVNVTDGYTGPVTSASPVTVGVRTPPLGAITGVVTDATGHPSAGASIFVTPGNFATSTNATGEYSVSVAAGTYQVSAQAPFCVPASAANVVVTSGHNTTVNFHLAWAVGWMAGTVTASGGGAPLFGAILYFVASDSSTTAVSTDATGHYNVTLAPSTYRVNVSAAGYVPYSTASVAVTAGRTTPMDFGLLPSPGRIYGTVRGSEGTPLANATVVIAQESGTGSIILYTLTTDGAGNFSKSLSPGTYIVTVTAQGYSPKNQTVTVAPGASWQVNFVLSPAPQSGEPPLSILVVAGLVGVAVLAAAVIVFLVLRRRAKQPPKNPPGTP